MIAILPPILWGQDYIVDPDFATVHYSDKQPSTTKLILTNSFTGIASQFSVNSNQNSVTLDLSSYPLGV